MPLCSHCNTNHDPFLIICPTTGYLLTCPKCGNVVEEKDAESCVQCGEFFPKPSAEPQGGDDLELKNELCCPKCQALVAPTDVDCPNCGEYLPGLIQDEENESKIQVVDEFVIKPDQEKPVPKSLQDVGNEKIELEARARRSRGPHYLVTLFLLFFCGCSMIFGLYVAWQKFFPSASLETAIPAAGTPSVISNGAQLATPTVSQTPTITPTATLTFTPTVTFTPSLTPTVTPTRTPTLPAFELINVNNADRLSVSITFESLKDARGVAFSPDGVLFASPGFDGYVNVWNSYYGSLVTRLDGNLVDPSVVAFSPDGETLYSSGDDYVIRSWDIETGQELQKMVGHSGWVKKIIFHPNGKMMASVDGSALLWNIETGKVMASFPSETDDIDFTPDEKNIAIPDLLTLSVGAPPYKLLTHTPIIRIRDLSSGDTLFVYTLSVVQADPGQITSIAFSPDGRKIAAGGPENAIWLGDVNSGYLSKFAYLDTNAQITQIAFSPDGTLLVAASTDWTVKFWDVRTKRLVTTLTGHSDSVRYIAFSPDGKGFASSSDDDTILIWRIK